MTEKLTFYFENPLMTVCLLFSCIPFWVPIMAFLLNGTDPTLMFMTAVLSIASGVYVSYSLRAAGKAPFKKSLTYTMIKLFAFMLVSSFLMEYGAMGDNGDIALAAIWILIAFYYFFLRSAYGFGILNILLWLFSLTLWGGFLYGLGSSYGLGAFLINLLIFHRQHGGAK